MVVMYLNIKHERVKYILNILLFNPLSANPTKWSSTLKQFVGSSRKQSNIFLLRRYFAKCRKLYWKTLRMEQTFLQKVSPPLFYGTSVNGF